MRIIPDFVLKTFSVTWGYSSLEFGPTSFGSQSPEYLAALYGFSIIFVNMTTSDCSVKGTGSLLLLYFFDHPDHLLVHLNEHEEALGLWHTPWPVIETLAQLTLEYDWPWCITDSLRLCVRKMNEWNMLDLGCCCGDHICVQKGSSSYIIILSCCLVPPLIVNNYWYICKATV